MINDRRVIQLIDKEDKNQSEAAKTLKVSRQAVSKRLQELRGRQCKAVVTPKIDEGYPVPDEVYQSIVSCMSGGRARMLIMFNPRAEVAPHTACSEMAEQTLSNCLYLTIRM